MVRRVRRSENKKTDMFLPMKTGTLVDNGPLGKSDSRVRAPRSLFITLVDLLSGQILITYMYPPVFSLFLSLPLGVSDLIIILSRETTWSFVVSKR